MKGMTTIVCVSDNHYLPLPDKLKAVINEADYFFYLGDGVAKLDDLLFQKNLRAVSGNCDAGDFPREEIIELGSHRALITHGHLYGIRTSLLPLKFRAEELKCDLVFYGHTHLAEIVEDDGITFINPGALSSPGSGTPSYAYCVLTPDKIVAKIVDLV